MRFEGGGSRDLDGEIIAWAWDFDGDGEYDWSSAAGGEAEHTYAEPGRYTATLRVTDDKGATGFDSVIIEVGEAKDRGPVNVGRWVVVALLVAGVAAAVLLARRER